MLLDEDIAWWYVLIGVVLLIPAVVASAFALRFMMVNNDSRRGSMILACALVIISVVLLAVWNLIYFVAYYDKFRQHKGKKDEDADAAYTKKMYIFWGLLIGIFIVAVFAYFICVCSNYRDALKDEEEEEEKMKKDEEDKDKKEDDMMKNDGMMGGD